MSPAFYHGLCLAGRVAVFIASRPQIEGADIPQRAGGCILAVNHGSVFDSMLAMACIRRPIRWFSATEISLSRWAWFFRLVGVIPLHRHRVDARAVREAIRLLRQGAIVGIFPEGRVRRGSDAVTAGGKIDEGVARLAALAGVPVVPCVIAGGQRFERWTGWIPLRGSRWAFRCGEPIPPGPDLTARLRTAFQELFPAAAAHADDD